MNSESPYPGAWGERGTGEPDPLFPAPGSCPAPDADLGVPVASLIECWRCGKYFPASQEQCPYCLARVRSQAPLIVRATVKQPAAGLPPLVKVVVFFGIILGISLTLGLVQRFGLSRQAPPRQQVENYWIGMILAELVDTLLVGIALAWIGRPRPLRTRSATARVLAWIYGGPVLLILFLLNVGYHRLLQGFLHAPQLADPILATKGLSIGVWLAYCVQPALVEETFFRYLALGCLRETVGTHGAVWLSAVMFGMAHVYNPLGIPYLILVGAALGYLRVASRGLALPMMLHFGHNAAVLLMETL